MKKVKYIKLPTSWKYELAEPEIFTLPKSVGTSVIEAKHIVIVGRVIRINEGYRWNGPSFAIDTENAMRASLLHDAMYDLMKQGLLDQKWRRIADKMYRRILKADGMSWFRRWYHWVGVRLGGSMFSHGEEA